MNKLIKCRDCKKFFKEQPGKRGFYNQCPNCSEKQSEPEPIGGNMVWDHKTAPTLELKPMKQAKEFARKQKRFGVGVLKSITQSRESNFGRE